MRTFCANTLEAGGVCANLLVYSVRNALANAEASLGGCGNVGRACGLAAWRICSGASECRYAPTSVEIAS